MRQLFYRLGTWLTGTVGFEVFKTTNRYVFVGIIISLYVALYVAFMASITAVVSFQIVQPGGNVAAGLALLPRNIGQCMSAVASAHVICHVLLVKAKIVKLAGLAA